MPETTFRPAVPDDAAPIAALHADSWRRHYRGAYADSYLDGDVETERRIVWSSRLAAPTGTKTIVAERDGRLTGFVHVVLDHDPTWGSLVDNLHVVHHQHRSGIGTALLRRVAETVTGGFYLWVLEQNIAAQRFYLALGAEQRGTGTAAAPGGDPSRLNGTPGKFRMAWPDGEIG